MGTKDFVGMPLSVSNTLTYDQKELYKFLKKLFTDRGYSLKEKDYTEKILADGKKLYHFNWSNGKWIDEITKSIIDVEFKAEVENVTIETHDGKKKTAQMGPVIVTFVSYFDRDPTSEWNMLKKDPYKTLFKEVWDKMLSRGKWERRKSALENDLEVIMSNLKTYLKVHRYD